MISHELRSRAAIASAAAVLVGGAVLASVEARSTPDRVVPPGTMNAKLKVLDTDPSLESGTLIANFADDYESTKNNRNDIVVESPMGGGFVDVNILTARDNHTYTIHAEMKKFSRTQLNPDTTRAIWTDEVTGLTDGQTQETTDTTSKVGGWSVSTANGVHTGDNGYIPKYSVAEPSDMRVQNELTGQPPNKFTTHQIHQAVKDAKKIIKDQSKTVSEALHGQQ